MTKAEKIFQKLGKKKKGRDFLNEETKHTISGALGGATAAVAVQPLDNRVTSEQNEAIKNYKDLSYKDYFKETDPQKRKDVAKKLLKKNYGGLTKKLLKVVPATAITFGVAGGTKKLLDQIDKEASISKQIKNYGDDVYKMVAKEIKNSYDVKDIDKFMDKNVGRLKVRRDGEVMDIQDRRIRNSFKTLMPGNKRIYMKVDANTGKAEITKRNKNIVTNISRPGKEVADKSSGKKLRDVLLGGGALATAGGAGYYAGSKEDDNYVKKKIRSL